MARHNAAVNFGSLSDKMTFGREKEKEEGRRWGLDDGILCLLVNMYACMCLETLQAGFEKIE